MVGADTRHFNEVTEIFFKSTDMQSNHLHIVACIICITCIHCKNPPNLSNPLSEQLAL